MSPRVMRRFLFAAGLSLTAAGAALSAPVAAPQDARDHFLSRCRERTLAQNPGADWAASYCAETWPAVTRSNPLVDAILSSFAEGAPAALDPADVKARPDAQAFEGALGPVKVVARRGPTTLLELGWTTLLELGWTAVGEPVPYEIVEALRTRDAVVMPIGCYAFGVGESNTVYRVEAAGRVPFAMTVYRREAPTGSAWSSLTITADAERHIPTLSSLKAAEPDAEWTADCS
jgi:hypothetical protein